MTKENTLANITKELDYRLGMYAFLARVFRIEIDQEFLDQLNEIYITGEGERQLSSAGEEILVNFLSRHHDNLIVDLAVDYVKVFIGARQKAGALPYESYYTSKEHLIMQEARDQVVMFYRAEGLDRSDQFTEPEDHIAFELEFMAYLCQKSKDYLVSNQFVDALIGLRKQRAFVETHLLNWTPDFLKDVAQSADTDFYKAIAKIASDLLMKEIQSIELLEKQINSLKN